MGVSSTEDRHPISPFLAKCYEMVDDQTTDSIISWSPTDSSSFVIWDVNSLQRDLLPKYYKHGNFSSFVRQLNTYGFRKCDPDRWEFINEGFVKCQKHLLRNISRRKPPKSQQQRQSQKKNKPAETLVQQMHLQQNNLSAGTIAQHEHLPQNNLFVGTRVEVGKFRPWEEVESLKKDRNLLMHEYMKLSQQQENSDNKLLRLRQRLKGMELNQQQMLSLLAMAVQSPGFLVQLLQQNESNWCVPEPSKTVSLPALQHGSNSGGPLASDNQIVRYEPLINEIPKPLLMPISNTEEAQQLDEYPNGLDELFMNIDVMSFAEGVSVSVEEDVPSENDDAFVCPEWPEDCISDLDKFLASPPFGEVRT